MPKYFYFCTSCESESSFYHDMSETIEDCTVCGEKTLQRRPSSFSSNVKDKNKKKTGDLVKSTIEEIKTELHQEKIDLKREHCLSDE